MVDMTPDQFFDALDELFGTDDGYVNHLERIKKLKVFKEDVIDATQCDNDLKDHQYIDYIEEMERSYDPELDEEREELIEYCKQEGREEKQKEINELNKQIDLQVAWKENEKTQRIKLEKENKELKDKYENFRVRNCNRMEEYVKALSPWKKNYQDHKRILEAIKELKEENEELKEQVKTLQYQLKDIEPEYEVMKESWIAPEDVNHIQDDYVKAMDELKSKTVKQISKLYQENKQTKKDIARVQKERNYLGDYCGGATSDDDN